MASSQRLACIDNLPNVWRVPELARVQERTLSTGHEALDSLLPGRGWPVGGLVEILQDAPGAHLWQLVLPALTASCEEHAGPVVLVDAPFLPFGPSLQSQGLAASRLMTITAGKPQSRMWACEQAIRCQDVAAVLAWLPNARAGDLRRLHLAAAQHDRLLFAMRGCQVQQEPSPARLRLLVEEGSELKLRILKRRGPPVEASIGLPSHPQRLQSLLASRHRHEGSAPPSKDRSHVLDRTVSFA